MHSPRQPHTDEVVPGCKSLGFSHQEPGVCVHIATAASVGAAAAKRRADKERCGQCKEVATSHGLNLLVAQVAPPPDRHE